MSLVAGNFRYNVTRNYLDWLTSLPWGKHTQDVFDVGTAIQVLDQDHYGCVDLKVASWYLSPCWLADR